MSDTIIDWTKLPCGVKKAPISQVAKIIPEVMPIIAVFPDIPENFSWDVKVHMLMPRQYPCIPHWHYDNVPRVSGIQRFDLVRRELPMYLWLSGPPLTQFEDGYVLPRQWFRFTQLDKHRGTASDDFTWRCFIRATHREIQDIKPDGHIRRHCQVYVDENTYQW